MSTEIKFAWGEGIPSTVTPGTFYQDILNKRLFLALSENPDDLFQISTGHVTDLTSGSVVIGSDSSTKALQQYSFSTGVGSIAAGNQSFAEGYYNYSGMMGFTIQKTSGVSGTGIALYLDSVAGIEPGMLAYVSVLDIPTGGWRPGVSGIKVTSVKQDEGYIVLESIPKTTDGQNIHLDVDGTSNINLPTGVEIDFQSRLAWKVCFRDYPYLGTASVSGRSHSEGRNNKATGDSSHSEGRETQAFGDYSHTQGRGTIAKGEASTAFGVSSKATADGSFASGESVVAGSAYQHVIGRYNLPDTNNTYAFIVGGGTSASAQRNLFTVKWDGSVHNDGPLSAGNITAYGSLTANKINASRTDSAASIVVGRNVSAVGTSACFGAESSITSQVSGIIGFDCSATHTNSTLFGAGLKSGGVYQTVVGKYNDNTAANMLFVVGNGLNDKARSNAFTVNSNGNAHASTSFSSPKFNIMGTTSTKSLSMSNSGDLMWGSDETVALRSDMEGLQSHYGAGNVGLIAKFLDSTVCEISFQGHSMYVGTSQSEPDDRYKVITKGDLNSMEVPYASECDVSNKLKIGSTIYRLEFTANVLSLIPEVA